MSTPARTARSVALRRLSVALALGLVALATLRTDPSSIGVAEADTLGQRTADIVANLLLFVPFGLASRGAGWRLWRTMALGCGISVAIELAQYHLPGRFPNPLDVLNNTLSSGLGWAAAAGLSRWRAAPLWLTALAAFAPPVAIGLTAILATPALPAGQRWFVQHAPNTGHYAPYPGAVQTVEVGGSSLPHGPLEASAPLVAALAAGATVELRYRPITATPRRAALLAVYDEARRLMLYVGVAGHDLYLQAHTWANRAQLTSPPRVWPGILAKAQGPLVSIRLQLDRCGWVVSVNELSTVLRPDAGRLWAAIHYPHWAAERAIIIDGIWWAAMLLPLGLFGGARRRWAAAIIGSVGLSCGVIAALNLGWPSAGAVLGAAIGLVAGRWLSRRRWPDPP